MNIVSIDTQRIFVAYRRLGTACRCHLTLFFPHKEANDLGQLFCMENVKNCESDWDLFAKLDLA